MASGFSRRFQTDKLMLNFHGKPVLAQMMETISSCAFTEKLLITQSDTHIDLAKNYGFIPYKNTHASLGQTASIHLGVTNANVASAYMFFVGDQPCLTKEVIDTLLAKEKTHRNSIIVPTVDAVPKNPVIFPSSFRDELLALKGDTGGKAIISSHPEQVEKVAFTDIRPFTDMDTPEDYQWLLSQKFC